MYYFPLETTANLSPSYCLVANSLLQFKKVKIEKNNLTVVSCGK